MSKRWAVIIKDGSREVISTIYESYEPSEVPNGYRVIEAEPRLKVNMERLPSGKFGFPERPKPVVKLKPKEPIEGTA